MADDGDSTGKGTAQAKVTINGEDCPKEAVAALVIEMDVDQPDMCTATLKNTNDKKYTQDLKMGDTVEVKITETGKGQPATVFKGEIAGLEPHYESGGETHCKLRAFSKLHRLSRGKKSKTYEKKTDAEIAKAISADYGLTCKVTGDVNIKHDHVYQHHQTDLEFLLTRAKRINYEVLVDDTTLYFRKRDVSVKETLTLEFGAKDDADGAPMKKFSLRLSSANQITAVKVRFWDPNTSKEIVGSADSLDSKLGGKTGGDLAKSAFSGGVHKITHDVPVSSTEEANAVAKALLEDHAMKYITGEAVCKGNPQLKAGIIVKVAKTDARFDGNYYITGATHKYGHSASGSGGYQTVLRLCRNAET